MINYYAVSGDQIKSVAKGSSDICWLHVETPPKEELKELSKAFQLPMDYLTAVLDDVENARTEGLEQEVFKRPILLVVEFPFVTTSPSGYLQYQSYPMSVIITPDKRLITVANHRPPFFDKVVTSKIQQNDMSPRMNIALLILWELVLSFNEHLEEINHQVSLLESHIQVATENKRLYQIMDIQKSLVFFESSTAANYGALKKLAHTTEFANHHAYQNHLHDILVETKQAVSTSRIYMRLVDQMTDTFSAIVSNNLNNIMKILTSLTIVLTIPTIIGGLYGMNVKLPFADQEWAFLLIIVGTIAICLWAIRYLRKKNLL
ncbi:magnesium transporter CorA family protein [Enterococcus sp.]|uniref:magnesium transporter CorA family protein n=1 Tax=Enterococcus sp. TaxID=35783 RepID=UPI001F96D5D8|nr:magnesium transporter CorA family protein [Candidatus Enterococcus stercoravium]